MTQFSKILAQRPTGWFCLATASVGFATAAAAETTTAPLNVSLLIYDECTVTGSTVDLGSYSEENTVRDVAARMGSISEAGIITRGTQAPQVIGSVNCPVDVPWTAVVGGGGNSLGLSGSYFDIYAQVSNGRSFAGVADRRLTAAVVAYDVDGVALPIDQIMGPGNAINNIGTGNPQDILGSVAIREVANANPNLVRGLYGNDGGVRLTVNFAPLP